MRYLPFLLFVAAIVAYVVYKYRGTTSKGQADHFGLPAGDSVRYLWICDFDTEISTAAKVGTAAAGLLFGQIATLRPMGASVAISHRNLLALVVETDDGGVERLLFAQHQGLRIEVLGQGSRRIQGGPSVVVRFTSAEGKTLQLLMHQSAQPYLEQWMAGSV